jgi:hypothetical protein
MVRTLLSADENGFNGITIVETNTCIIMVSLVKKTMKIAEDAF